MTSPVARLRALSVPALLVAAVLAVVPAAARAADDEEVQMGAQLFNQLKAQGEIVKSSPLYDSLRPISSAITKAVQPDYPYPIHFYIVHESQPNAFAAPGGNIYVVDSLMYFVKNSEELAGTICHETSHLLHHDSVELMKRNEQIRARAIAATILLPPTVGSVLAVTAISQLDSNHYSREAEEAADLTGADTCARADYNPWGLVWLFGDFSNANLKSPPEILSDHPNNAHRIERLKQHFVQAPATFSKFDPDPKSAKPLQLPANEQEEFLR
jgi:beta-barrel assembly-enhancing protease